MPCSPLAVARAAHPLALVLARVGAVDGGAGEARVAVAAAQLPALLVEASQQTGLALHWDPLAALTGQVADAAQAGCAVPGAHAAGHLWGCGTQRLKVIITALRKIAVLCPQCHSITFCAVEAICVAALVHLHVSLPLSRAGGSTLSSVAALGALRDKAQLVKLWFVKRSHSTQP